MPSRKAPDRSSFGSLLSRAARQWRRAADLRLAPFDLTEATWLPLVHIARAPAPPRQKDLAASMSLDGSSVVRLLDNLEAAGLIRRKEGERPAGKDHPADGARPRHRRQGRDGGAPDQGRCAAGLSDKDIETTVRVLQHVCRALDAPRKPSGVSAPLWLLTLITFSGTLAMHIFVPALPEAARDLGASVGGMQLTVSVYILGLAVGQLAYGPLSDRFGRRPVLMAGLVLYALAGLAAAFAPDVHSLIVARLLQALGGCAGLVIGRAIVRDTALPQEAARRMAMMNLMVAIGPGAAPIVGGALASTLGWRSIFFALALLGIVNLLFSWRLLPESKAPAATAGSLEPGPQLRPAAGLAGLPGLCGGRRLRHDVDVRLHRRLALHLRPSTEPAGLRGRHLSRHRAGGRLDRQRGGHPPDPAAADRSPGRVGQPA